MTNENIEVIQDRLHAIEEELEAAEKQDQRIKELEQAIRVIHSVDQPIVDPSTMVDQLRVWANDLQSGIQTASLNERVGPVTNGIREVANDIERQIQEQDDGS